MENHGRATRPYHDNIAAVQKAVKCVKLNVQYELDVTSPQRALLP